MEEQVLDIFMYQFKGASVYFNFYFSFCGTRTSSLTHRTKRIQFKIFSLIESHALIHYKNQHHKLVTGQFLGELIDVLVSCGQLQKFKYSHIHAEQLPLYRILSKNQP